MTLCRHTPMTFLNRVFEPRYHTKDFLPDCNSIRYAKNQLIKVVFPKVNATNVWSGEWVIKKKDITSRKKFINNGRECYVVPLEKLERISIKAPCEHDY